VHLPDRERTDSIYPTVGEINALPDNVRQYIHDLETRMNTEGKALTILELANERDALLRRVEELDREIALHRRIEDLEAQVALLTHPKLTG
jgi:hypothetical protein